MTHQDHPDWLLDLLNELPDQREPDYENKVRLRGNVGLVG